MSGYFEMIKGINPVNKFILFLLFGIAIKFILMEPLKKIMPYQAAHIISGIIGLLIAYGLVKSPLW